MRTSKWLLFGSSVMLLVAILSLFLSQTFPVSAGGPTCDSTGCYVFDTTINDFAQGQFYATGLSNNGDGAVQLLPIGITSPWNPDSNTLPASRAELATAIYNNKIFVIGGVDTTGNPQTSIFAATTYITGGIQAPGFTTVSNLPIGLSGMPATIYSTGSGGFLYVPGGNTNISQVYTSTVYYQQFDANGNFFGGWKTTSAPMPIPLVYHQAVVHNGYLYIIGGYEGFSTADPDISYGLINPSTGDITSWTTQSGVIPNNGGGGLSSFSAVIWQSGTGTDYLYLIGGGIAGSYNVPDVSYAAFNSNGSVGSFTLHTSDLPLTLMAQAAVQFNGQIFVSGGLEGINITPTLKVQSSLIDPTGALHDWGGGVHWISSSPLPEARNYHGSVVNSGGEVYVIGGYGPTGKATNTVYHGSTTGFGSTYAPNGNYLSRVISLGGQQNLDQIAVNSTITDVVSTTLTVRYRVGNDQNFTGAVWKNLPSLTTGTNITSTFSITDSGVSYLQYQAFFTTTKSSETPILNAVQAHYTPPSDLLITYMEVPPAFASGSPASQTVTITVSNYGQGPARPVRKLPTIIPALVPQTRSLGGRRAPAATSHYFWVDVYVDHKPTGPSDLGECYNSWQLGTYPLPPGTSGNILISGCSVSAGTHNFYAQVDTCPNPGLFPPTCPTEGQIIESNENNNITGPLTSIIGSSSSIITGTGGLYLPLILKNH